MRVSVRTAILATTTSACAVLLYLGTSGCSQRPQGEPLDGQVLRAQVEALAIKVDQQSALLHRALGKHIPVSVPAETDQQLKQIEARLTDSAQWPTTAADADQLRDQLDRLAKQLPPWAEDELLPRLNSVRWGVRTIWLARHHQDVPPAAAAELADDAQSLLQAAPPGTSDGLKKLLADHIRQLNGKAQQHADQGGRNRAQQALEGKEDLLGALQGLEGLEGDEIGKLRSALRQRLLDQDTDRKLGVLQTTLAAVGKLPNDVLQISGLHKIQDALAGMLLDLHAEQPPRLQAIDRTRQLLSQCEQQVKTVAARQQAAYEQKVRDYQAWALREIRYFDSDSGWHYDVTLPWVRSKLTSFKNATEVVDWELFGEFSSTKILMEEKLDLNLKDVAGSRLSADKQKEIYNAAAGNVGWKANIDEEIAYRVTRDCMVKKLLPINPALLDPAVAQLYNKAFQKGWSKLEGRPDQLHVAEQSAVVKKRGLD